MLLGVQFKYHGREYSLVPSARVRVGVQRLPASAHAFAVIFGQRRLDPTLRREFVGLLDQQGALSPGMARRVSDDDLKKLISSALRTGALVLLEPQHLREDFSTPEERVAAAAMGDKRHFTFDNQHLSLVPAAAWERLRQDDALQVVREKEAREILAALRDAPGVSRPRAKALSEAESMLADRVVPGRETGLLLLRRRITRSYSTGPEIPSVTPSELRSEKEPPKRVTVFLERLYHDDEPVHGAPFELIAADGSVVRGKLGDAGSAAVKDLPEGVMKVRFGPDARPYEVKDQRKNPEFTDAFTPAAAETLVSRYVK